MSNKTTIGGIIKNNDTYKVNVYKYYDDIQNFSNKDDLFTSYFMNPNKPKKFFTYSFFFMKYPQNTENIFENIYLQGFIQNVFIINEIFPNYEIVLYTNEQSFKLIRNIILGKEENHSYNIFEYIIGNFDNKILTGLMKKIIIVTTILEESYIKILKEYADRESLFCENQKNCNDLQKIINELYQNPMYLLASLRFSPITYPNCEFHSRDLDGRISIYDYAVVHDFIKKPNIFYCIGKVQDKLKENCDLFGGMRSNDLYGNLPSDSSNELGSNLFMAGMIGGNTNNKIYIDDSVDTYLFDNTFMMSHIVCSFLMFCLNLNKNSIQKNIRDINYITKYYYDEVLLNDMIINIGGKFFENIYCYGNVNSIFKRHIHNIYNRMYKNLERRYLCGLYVGKKFNNSLEEYCQPSPLYDFKNYPPDIIKHLNNFRKAINEVKEYFDTNYSFIDKWLKDEPNPFQADYIKFLNIFGDNNKYYNHYKNCGETEAFKVFIKNYFETRDFCSDLTHETKKIFDINGCRKINYDTEVKYNIIKLIKIELHLNNNYILLEIELNSGEKQKLKFENDSYFPVKNNNKEGGYYYKYLKYKSKYLNLKYE